MESARKRRKVSSQSPVAPIDVSGEYAQVCATGDVGPDRMRRLVALARHLNIPASPYMNPTELCGKIRKQLSLSPPTQATIAALPREMIEEIELHLPTRLVQAIRTTTSQMRSTAPATRQWLNKYNDKLVAVGLAPEQYPKASLEQRQLYSLFDDLSTRSAFEYLLSRYGDFFWLPGQAQQSPSGISTGQFVYSFIPGQLSVMYPDPNMALFHEIARKSAHITQMKGEEEALITLLATRFPTPVEASASHVPFDVIIRLIINDEGRVTDISEIPAQCTPGREDVLLFLLQNQDRGARLKGAVQQFAPGEYAQMLAQVNPAAYQQGYYPPEPTPQMIELGDVLSLENRQRFMNYFARWTSHGFILSISSTVTDYLPGLTCFSKATVAHAFIQAIKDLKLFRWATLSTAEQQNILGSLLPIAQAGADRWNEVPQEFPQTSDDLYALALGVLYVNNIQQYPHLSQEDMFLHVRNLLTTLPEAR